MKTPKEKAEDLINKFMDYADACPDDYDWMDPISHSDDKQLESAKKCALIAVDEILKSLPSIVLVSVNGDKIEYSDKEKYWQQVKQAI